MNLLKLLVRCVFLPFVFLSVNVCLAEDSSTSLKNAPQKTMDVMMQTVVPQSNIIWRMTDEPKDSDWAAVKTSAEKLIEASDILLSENIIADERHWVDDDRWRKLVLEMKQATEVALDAIARKDLDQFYEAGDNIYPPCESCHAIFNPAVAKNN